MLCRTIVAACFFLIPHSQALEVIGSGFGRTGTESTKKALDILGYKTYHMKEIIENSLSDHVLIWEDMIKDGCKNKTVLRTMVSVALFGIVLASS
jgi:hypothetical protein